MVGLQRLGGAGLAADAVALHPGILAGAAVHHLLQDRTAALTGLRADHLSHLVGLIVLEHIALAVGHLADHIGLHQMAAVDDGGGRCDELNGVTWNRWPKDAVANWTVLKSSRGQIRELVSISPCMSMPVFSRKPKSSR